MPKQFDSDEAKRAYQASAQRRSRARKAEAMEAEVEAERLQQLRRTEGNDPDAMISWIQRVLRIPPGAPRAGKRFKLLDFQQDFIRAAYAGGIFEAGLSCARKNGKTALTAALALWALCGHPEAAGWRGLAVSLSAKHVSELRDQILNMALASGLSDTIEYRRSPAPGYIQTVDDRQLHFLASDSAKTGQSIAADLAIVDELGIFEDAARNLYDGVRGAASGRAGLVISISVKGNSSMFDEIRLAAADGETTSVWHEYAAPENADIMDPEAWAAANPGLAAGVKSLRWMQSEARRAMRTPLAQPSFRLYHLNQPGVTDRQMILTLTDFDRAVTENPPARQGPAFVSLDLGQTRSLSGAAAFWWQTGRLEVWAGCGGIPSLRERSQQDGNDPSLYEHLAETDQLRTYDGFETVPIVAFVADVAKWMDGEAVHAMMIDNFKAAAVRDAARAADVRWPIVTRRMGHGADGHADTSGFERCWLEGGVRLGSGADLLKLAISGSAIDLDANNNVRVVKNKSAASIDALSATVLAVAAGHREARKPRRRRGIGRRPF